MPDRALARPFLSRRETAAYVYLSVWLCYDEGEAVLVGRGKHVPMCMVS